MKRGEGVPASKTCYEIPSTMNAKTAGYLILYGGFLIFCWVLGYLSNPEKAKTALMSGGTFGALSIVWGVLGARGVRWSLPAALVTTRPAGPRFRLAGECRLDGCPRWQIRKIVRSESDHPHAGRLGADAPVFAEVPKDRRTGTTGEQRAMTISSVPQARDRDGLFQREENSTCCFLIVHVATSPRFTPPPLTCTIILRRSSLDSWKYSKPFTPRSAPWPSPSLSGLGSMSENAQCKGEREPLANQLLRKLLLSFYRQADGTNLALNSWKKL
jgi:hypothetical protein